MDYLRLLDNPWILVILPMYTMLCKKVPFRPGYPIGVDMIKDRYR